jgi:plastocyanin
MRLMGLLAGTMAVAMIGCGGGGGDSSGPPPPSGNTPPPTGGITVFNDRFSPITKTIAAGTSVQWGWNTCTGDGGYGGGEVCVAHNVTFDDGPASPTQDSGGYSRTFNTASTYNYHCTLHPSFMTGTIIVQ